MKSNATVFSVKGAAIAAGGFVIVPPPKTEAMTEESDNPLGDYVRAVMMEHGLSAEAVSKIADKKGYENLRRSAIGQIISGKTKNPGIHTLDALAAGLNRPLEELLAKALGRSFGTGQIPSDFATLADLYRQIPLSEQRGVKRYWLQTLERELRRMLKQLVESG